MGFVPPTAAELERAIGLEPDAPPLLRRALDLDDGVELLARPGSHDWLSVHDERPQTFEDFRAACPERHLGDAPLCIQPIDDLLVHAGPCLERMVAFTGAFFMRDVIVLPAVELPHRRLRSRVDRESGQSQYFAGDLLLELAAARPPAALCLLGLTTHDIYPDLFVQFAFGEASSLHRVALCSMARYRPPFREESAGREHDAVFHRCVRMLCHEVCHILGLDHCVYARCLMNGSSELEESDRRPLHLCPVDLRKLQWTLGFNVVERYRRLLHVWSGMGDDPEGMWVSRRLRHVLDGWGPDSDAMASSPATAP